MAIGNLVIKINAPRIPGVSMPQSALKLQLPEALANFKKLDHPAMAVRPVRQTSRGLACRWAIMGLVCRRSRSANGPLKSPGSGTLPSANLLDLTEQAIQPSGALGFAGTDHLAVA